jgi:glucose/mannose-6-phosphate isomerase
MKKLIEDFSKQLTESLQIAEKATLSPSKAPIQNVVIAGLGGSGIGGNLVQAFTFDSINVPINITKTYEIPSFVSANTLFIACSFSGNTEETTSAVAKAIAKGAKIVCVTSGGKLGEIAAANGLDVINIPGRSNSPRASIGYSIVQLLTIFNFFGLISTNHWSEIKGTIALLDAENANILAEAQTLAGKMKGRLPILYSDARLEAVIVRTQQQINENSKQLCHVNVFPEMNHNELVGWVYPVDLIKNSLTVMVTTDFDHERVGMRMEICRSIFRERGSEVVDLKAKGGNIIEQSFYLIHLLDWVSFFLAEINNVDPFPVEVINFLKAELGKR